MRLHSTGPLLCGTMVFPSSSETVRLMDCCIHHTKSPEDSPFVLLAPINSENRKHRFSFWPLSVFLIGHELNLALLLLTSAEGHLHLVCFSPSYSCVLIQKTTPTAEPKLTQGKAFWLCFLTFSWIPSSSPAKYKMGTLSSEAATHCRTACSCLF